MPELAQTTDGLHPPKDLFHEFSFDLVANWAYMAIATLAFNLKAWLGLLLPTRAGGAQLLTMDFRRFIHALILIPAHIKNGSRRLTFRILSYNRWVRLILEGSQRLRQLQLA